MPPNRVPQTELMQVAAAIGPGLMTMFENARVQQRALAMPVPWYMRPHGFAERNAAFVQAGMPLIEQAARGALDGAGITAAELDGIVFVTTTGIATPSMDAWLATRLGCRPDVQRTPVWGLGCAGGVAGVNLAAQLARASGGHHLVVCLELCSLSFDGGQANRPAQAKKTMAAASLFGDGCAALVVSGQGEGPRHVRGTRHLFPDTQRVMGWDVHDDHLEVVLSPQIPAIVAQNMARLVADASQGDPIHHWVMHPGGAKVIDAYEEALALPSDALAATKGVLNDHGNMSSPTVLFVLQRAMQRMGPGQNALLAALGPGFASEMAWIRT